MYKKVGTLTFALTLIVIGVTALADKIAGTHWLEQLLSFWPIILISFGFEIVWHQSRVRSGSENRMWRVDGKSIFLLIIVLIIATGYTRIQYLGSVLGSGGLAGLLDTTIHGNSQSVQLKDQTVPADRVNSVSVDDSVGSISVVGTDRTDIKVTATAWVRTNDASEAKKRANLIDVQLSQGPDTHILVTDRGQNSFGFDIPTSVDILLEVPSKMKVQIHSNVGRVEAGTINGIDVHTNVASVTLHNVGGSVQVFTNTGKIEVDDITGSTVLHTDTGSITANRIGGDLDVSTETGQVSFTDTAKAVHAHASMGAINGTVSSALGGSYDIDTHAGAIRLDISSKSSAAFQAQTDAGSIGGSLDWAVVKQGIGRTANATLGDGKNKVSVRTNTGSITVNTD